MPDHSGCCRNDAHDIGHFHAIGGFDEILLTSACHFFRFGILDDCRRNFDFFDWVAVVGVERLSFGARGKER